MNWVISCSFLLLKRSASHITVQHKISYQRSAYQIFWVEATLSFECRKYMGCAEAWRKACITNSVHTWEQWAPGFPVTACLASLKQGTYLAQIKGSPHLLWDQPYSDAESAIQFIKHLLEAEKTPNQILTKHWWEGLVYKVTGSAALTFVPGKKHGK